MTGPDLSEEQIITAHFRLACGLARRHCDGGEYDDVLADALLGMLTGLRSWRPGAANNCSLRTWLAMHASYAIIDGKRERGPIPRREYAKVSAAERASDGSADGERLALAAADALTGWFAIPLEMPPGHPPGAEEQEHLYLVDTLAVDERGYGAIETAETLALLLLHLSRKERYIVEQTFLRGRSLAELAVEFGVTTSRITQVRSRALTKLRRRLRDDDD